ncbi:MAG: hypothetical protein HZA49_08640 [Planctomycetes bacterium]|nr:hypothetical protein [Planctomycetota bacterium]
MLTKVSFKNQLCHICLQSFSPVHLVRVNNHAICHDCQNLVELSESNPPPPESIPMAELDTTKQENIAKIIAREGAVFIDKVKQLNAITPGLVSAIIARVAVYLPGLLYLDTQNEWYPIISGVMTADFVTWVLFNTMQLPFISRGAVLEFLIYGGMTSFLVSKDRLLNIPSEGPPMAYAALAFLGAGFAKTAYWGLKVFIFDDMEGEGP